MEESQSLERAWNRPGIPLNRQSTFLTQFFALFASVAVLEDVPRFVLLTKPSVQLVDGCGTKGASSTLVCCTPSASRVEHHQGRVQEDRVVRQTFPSHSGPRTDERGVEGFCSERNA